MRYVYLLRNGENYYKVGIAANVTKRIRALQTSNPERIDLICCRLVDDAEAVESRLHEYLVENKSGGGQEWFRLTTQQAMEVAVMLNAVPEVVLHDDLLQAMSVMKQNRSEFLAIKESLREIHKYIYASKRLAAAAAVSEKESAISLPQLMETMEPKGPSDEDMEEKAKELVVSMGRASASMLQRHLCIGYGRAARILDNLERRGVVGPGNGAKPREVFKRAA